MPNQFVIEKIYYLELKIFLIGNEELRMKIVLPSTNVISDYFLVLKCVKTYLWNTASSTELNYLIIINAHKAVPRTYVWMNYVRDLLGEKNLENCYLLPWSNQVCRGTLARSNKLEVILYNNYLWENIMALKLCWNLIHNDNFWRYILRYKFNLIDFK